MSYIVEDANKTNLKLHQLDKKTKTISKPNYVMRIVYLFRNCKETSIRRQC